MKAARIRYFHTQDEMRTVQVMEHGVAQFRVALMNKKGIPEKILGTYSRRPHLVATGEDSPPVILFDIREEEAYALVGRLLQKTCPLGMEEDVLPYPLITAHPEQIQNAIKEARLIHMFGYLKLPLHSLSLGGLTSWNSLISKVMDYFNNYEEMRMLG